MYSLVIHNKGSEVGHGSWILGIAGVSAAFTGPGAFSLDALFGVRSGGALWGATAVLVGVAGAAIPLGWRRDSAPQPAAA
jgi:hypothetical protein